MRKVPLIIAALSALGMSAPAAANGHTSFWFGVTQNSGYYRDRYYNDPYYGDYYYRSPRYKNRYYYPPQRRRYYRDDYYWHRDDHHQKWRNHWRNGPDDRDNDWDDRGRRRHED
jgi:hypothetical protein